MMYAHAPLTDITNVQIPVNLKQKPPRFRRHDPYSFKCLNDEDSFLAIVSSTGTSSLYHQQELFHEREDQASVCPSSVMVCSTLVQFKCHQAEYSCPFAVGNGQYVVVQGDRGIDIGAIIHIDAETNPSLEVSSPCRSVLRFATQKEVDYWASDLKDAEAEAVAFCQTQVMHHGLDMTVAHAEYQYDKKKLTFYYDSCGRVEFVQLLKELYREFGCRIWMEKVLQNE